MIRARIVAILGRLRDAVLPHPVPAPEAGQVWVSEYSGSVMRVERVEISDTGELQVDVERQYEDNRPRRGLRWGMPARYASSLSAWRARIRAERRRRVSPPRQSPPAPVPALYPLTAAVADVLAERQRQVRQEKWTPEHDDEHRDGDMARAAAAYVLSDSDVPVLAKLAEADRPIWPWSLRWWKPKDGRRNLVRAAALLVAEIERLDRREATTNREGAAA